MRKLRYATVLMAALLTAPGIVAAQEAPVEGIQVHGEWTVEIWTEMPSWSVTSSATR